MQILQYCLYITKWLQPNWVRACIVSALTLKLLLDWHGRSRSSQEVLIEQEPFAYVRWTSKFKRIGIGWIRCTDLRLTNCNCAIPGVMLSEHSTVHLWTLYCTSMDTPTVHLWTLHQLYISEHSNCTSCTLNMCSIGIHTVCNYSDMICSIKSLRTFVVLNTPIPRTIYEYWTYVKEYGTFWDCAVKADHVQVS